MATGLTARSPALLHLLGHRLRWTLVRELAEGDLRVRELVALTGQAPSLVSYHLGRLRAAGLLTVRRSAADARDSYYALDLDALGHALRETAHAIHPGLLPSCEAQSGNPDRRPRVLFVCTGNSSRSQMAEGWLRHLAGPQVEACSGGTEPTAMHPLAVAAMRERDVDIASHSVKHVSVFAGQAFERLVTLCDRARERCPELSAAKAVHWSIPNPTEAHPPDLDAFRATARELERRVRFLLPLAISWR